MPALQTKIGKKCGSAPAGPFVSAPHLTGTRQCLVSRLAQSVCGLVVSLPALVSLVEELLARVEYAVRGVECGGCDTCQVFLNVIKRQGGGPVAILGSVIGATQGAVRSDSPPRPLGCRLREPTKSIIRFFPFCAVHI